MMFSMKRTVPRSCLAPSIMTPSACFVPYSGAPLLTRLPSVSDSSILPEELATQSVRLKEEQLRREEEKVCGCECY
jgi:hypothetical protein